MKYLGSEGLFVGNHEVWHEGNFNPNDKLDKEEFDNHVAEKAWYSNVHGLRENNLALGENSSASAVIGAMALGPYSEANDAEALAVGFFAKAAPAYSVAIGAWSQALVGGASVALGSGTFATNAIATAVGSNTSASGYASTAIGYGASASNDDEGVLGGSGIGTTRNWQVPGNFTVQGSKNFQIDHPNPEKSDLYDLRHSVVESPNAQNLYRYTIEATYDGETVELELPDYFMYLNKGPDVWVNGDRHFGRAFGWVEGNTLKVTCETAGRYKCLIIGTRCDSQSYIGPEVKPKGLQWDGTTETFEVTEIMEITEIEEVA